MTIVDALIILIVLGGIVLGYRKGFINQLSSLVSWVVAIVLCYKCGDLARDIFLSIVPSAEQWPLSSITVKTVSLAFAFLIIMLIIRLVMRLFKGALDTVHLGFIDKMGGSLLFMFKYAFVLSIVLNLLYAFNPDMDTFGTMHMMDNKPYEFTLDLMPHVLGSEQMPSDSLKLYRDLIEPVPVDEPLIVNQSV
ncbi:MAG: CvpA family protein [Muribaculaceae bacterium]|nr:CvpA family protein [Muribaculaceae bacterium]